MTFRKLPATEDTMLKELDIKEIIKITTDLSRSNTDIFETHFSVFFSVSISG